MSPDDDRKTYAPVCLNCGHRGDRHFQYTRPPVVGGVLRDVLAPSLGPDHLSCSVCESVNINMEPIGAER